MADDHPNAVPDLVRDLPQGEEDPDQVRDAAALLHAWLSPSYPVGAYTYSHGLERAVEAGNVHDPASLGAWVGGVLAHGAGWTDAVLLAHAYRDPADAEIAELAEALAPSAERHLETMAQGRAFAEVTASAWGIDTIPAPYPVALGRAAAAAGIPLSALLPLYLQAFASNLISAGIRLVPIGQTDGQRQLAGLLRHCAALARRAEAAGLDDIGSAAFAADIASMQHETQHTRLFRS
ncbi:MAG: urease accessory protein UreF [Pseudomonadota bacterium]